MSRETIKVCCRFRKEFDHAEDEYDSWQFEDETATIYYGERNTKTEKKWVYDYILPPDTTQEQMYEKVAKKTIVDFTEGYNGTIFAYGQSGSGKTYSMLGPDSVFETLASSTENELYGITPRAVYQIFNIFKDFDRNGTKWKLSLSYIEIYNEKIKCLLSKKDGLKIREDPNEGFIIPEKDSIDCQTPLSVFEGINLASKNRATGATNQNERSSRSHAILQLELIYNSIDGLVRKSHLSLVDLAGSERIAKTGAEGQRLKEAQKINQSLTTLGMVIMSLTTPGSKHIPFRNSKLTLILKDSLGGSSKTTLLCTASRLKRHSEESIQTLYFASRAKTIKNNAKKNIILSAGELQYLANGLKKEIMLLRGQIKNIGYQWRLIEDKKILSFCNNEEFLKDPNSPIAVLDKKESSNATNTNIANINNQSAPNENTNNNKENNNNSQKEKTAENNNNNNTQTNIKNEKDEKQNSNNSNSNITKANNKNETDERDEEDKDALIDLLKVNMKTERELLQLIIDELNEKLDKKEKENMELLKTIDQLNKTIKNLNNNNNAQGKDKDKNKELKIDSNIQQKTETKNISFVSLPSIDLSGFEKEKNELQFQLDKKDEEIRKILKEKEKTEEQNIFISKDNQQLRQKINELKAQIIVLQNNPPLSTKSSEDYDFKKEMRADTKSDLRSGKSKDKTESRRVSQVRNTFGVVLKKVQAGKNVVDYIMKAQEENAKRQKEAEVLFGKSELYKELHKNVIEYDSPCTVSSNSDILEIDMPELNFANPSNDEAFIKAEEQLYSKEMEHLKEKKRKQENK